MRLEVYRGIGNLRVATPRGEVSACPGDLILNLPSGRMVFDPDSARSVFGGQAVRLLSTQVEISMRDLMDLSSPTQVEPLSPSSALDVDYSAGLIAGMSSVSATNSPSDTQSNALSDVNEGSNSQTAGSTKK